MRSLIPLSLVAAFCWLGYYSLTHAPKPESEGDFVARKVAEYEAQQIQSVYNITDEEIGKPVILWRN